MTSKQTTKKVLHAINDGARTNAAIEEHTGLADVTVSDATRELAKTGVLARERAGRAYEYTVADTERADALKNSVAEPFDVTVTADDSGASFDGESDAEDDHRMKVYRDTDWTDDIPDPEEVVAYVPVGGELDEIAVQVALREEFNHRPVFMLTGPTACGKTTLASNIAANKLQVNASEKVRNTLGDALDMEPMPYFEVQVHDQMVPADLFGSPTLIGGETVWVDGPVTKALRASQEGPTVLTLDEITRAPPQAKSALFDLLDHRCRVKLDGGRGGEVIQGDPTNLIVVATANVGTGHYVENMDIAEQRRWKAAWPVDYLGRVDADVDRPDETPEADLLVSETGVSEKLASKLVSVANDIRNRADDPSSRVTKKIPTGALMEWAEDAQMNSMGGIENPVVRAGRAAVVSVFYEEDGRGDVTDEVVAIIEGEFDGLDGVSDAAVEAHERGEQTVGELGDADPDSTL